MKGNHLRACHRSIGARNSTAAGMKRRWIVAMVVAVSLCSTVSRAESSGSSERASGFAIEVDLVASRSLFGNGELFYEFGLTSPISVVPQLSVGAQIRRVGLGLVTSIDLFNYSEEDYSASLLTVRVGPRIDGEIWGSGRVALFLYGGADLLVSRDIDDDGDQAGWTGFSLDFGIGGRVYAVRQLAISLKIGTMVDMSWYDYYPNDPPPDWDSGSQERMTMWSLYGALALRFITAR
jgi:hypothetical protein